LDAVGDHPCAVAKRWRRCGAGQPQRKHEFDAIRSSEVEIFPNDRFEEVATLNRPGLELQPESLLDGICKWRRARLIRETRRRRDAGRSVVRVDAASLVAGRHEPAPSVTFVRSARSIVAGVTDQPCPRSFVRFVCFVVASAAT
jgi:hypothetical protein